MSTEVAVRQSHAVASLDDLERMANAIAKSGLFGVKEPLQALALMLLAQAENLHPATVALDWDIINGRAARKTHSVLARFQAAGGKVSWGKFSDEGVTGTFSHPNGGEVTIDWDLARAARTKVWNNKKNTYETLADRIMYESYPRAMFRARCVAEGVRAVYPAAIGGALVPEEARYEDPIDMGQAVVVEQPKAKPKTAATPEIRPDKPDVSGPSAAAPKTASPPTSLSSSAPSAAAAGDAVPSSAPQENGSTGADAGPKSEPAEAEPIEGELMPPPTLADCLALADKAAEDGRLMEILPTLTEYRKQLNAEDQATLDSTLKALMADQGLDKVPSGPPLSAGQKRILTARLKSNGKTIEQFEAKFGKMESCPASRWEECQAWCSQ